MAGSNFVIGDLIKNYITPLEVIGILSPECYNCTRNGDAVQIMDGTEYPIDFLGEFDSKIKNDNLIILTGPRLHFESTLQSYLGRNT